MSTIDESSESAPKKPVRRVAKRAAGAPVAPAPLATAGATDSAPSLTPVAKKSPAKKAVKKSEAKESAPATPVSSALSPIFQAPDLTAVKAPAKTSVKAPTKAAALKAAEKAKKTSDSDESESTAPVKSSSRTRTPAKSAAKTKSIEDSDSTGAESDSQDSAGDDDDSSEGAARRRRRRRGGRGRKRSGDTRLGSSADGDDEEGDTESSDESGETGDGATRRRRVRERRAPSEVRDDVVVRSGNRTRTSSTQDLAGSTRIEAKRQRRRDGRDNTRKRAPILTEAQFLARREAVDRVMLVRQTGDRTQIAVLEDNILVEHYVNRSSNTSYVGNIYLGRVQNVLPSMEAAFVDIGKGRNAVLYAGEVNWDAAGIADGTPRRIETALKTGQQVLVQVTKDPIGQKGARLTSQVSLPGRYLVFVPGGGMSGISRRLPDAERARLKHILKDLVPEEAGVIVRTAAEGATEDELTRDITRLKAQWEDIEKKTESASNSGSTAPTLLYGEPDLTVRVIRDIFNEDFKTMLVQGSEAWDEINGYLGHVAPDLVAKIQRWTSDRDMFTDHRVEEQLVKALDRKVWLPSGGSLVIDRTEAMVVVDVNTGKFTGKGGNLEETVTKNNIEAAEEIARQLRLRDLGGIIVIDFIDMVLESNRDQVLRRLVECLGRDRTKHQVAEVTSLGLVQMTRKRVGQGLIEAFSNVCESCHGRGIHVSLEPIDRSTHRPSSEGGFSHSSGPVKELAHQHDHSHDSEDVTPLDHDEELDISSGSKADAEGDGNESAGETLVGPRGLPSVPSKGGARRARRGKGR
ncbi:unannotated protein [freshwater metagenome]|uniref:Unannotated protein n=1 Tax=freshwater metagenome TaxID=449393 RepID=A0A6J6N498_9ZZZZ|nr:Rne/Rng family ribonuclease [Actinomycetota bacterium]MSY51490.1 Rne/Rng family ribonuclease [Actinomycetota bacterium]MSY87862.1 Rne/Rng family ribonuclease [Actinomycetota bacterium]MTA50898.1 Rne/Rng family ribonuclease [Actinomycetota bacterium]